MDLGVGHAPGLSQRQHRRLARAARVGSCASCRCSLRRSAPPAGCRRAGRGALPALPARAEHLGAGAGRARGRERLGAARLRGPGAGARAAAQVPRRDRAGRPHGGADRRERARGRARARARAGAVAAGARRAGAASTRRSCSREALAPAPGCRCLPLLERTGDAQRQVGRAPRPAPAQRRRVSPRLRAAGAARWCWSTTWSRPAPRWARAHRLCARRAGSAVMRSLIARTPVR